MAGEKLRNIHSLVKQVGRNCIKERVANEIVGVQLASRLC